jgi:S1-C subfamily serine protease
MMLETLVEPFGGGLRVADVLLIGLLVMAALGGLRAGLLARAATWFGLLGGVILAGRTVPGVLGLLEAAGLSARLFVAVLTFGATVTVTTFVVQLVLAPVRRLLRFGPLSILDRGLGGIASGLAVLIMVWLLIPTAAAIPGRISTEVRASELLTRLDAATPPPPDVARSLRTLLGGDRYPDVFASLVPTPTSEEPPDLTTVPTLAVDQALASATRITVIGCGRQYSGSGFALSDTLVMTNAHVVAGGREIELVARDGRRLAAEVVVFDKDRDLALLVVEPHGLLPLELAEHRLGETAAVAGFPGGQSEVRIAPALVERSVRGVGRDIYGRSATERELVFLAAELRAGDSGAAVVNGDGRVVAVVFAISPDAPGVAYALASSEASAVLAAPRVPGDAGRCI